jgi:septal ring factor EnvC (AmiA/AmiB activator)
LLIWIGLLSENERHRRATYELLKCVHCDIGELKREVVQIKQRLGSVEQPIAVLTTDVARINGDLDEMRGDISRIKIRLDLVDA